MQRTFPDVFRQACLIGGQWVQASDGATIAVENPFDHSPVGTVPACTAADVRRAIEAAAAAWPAWREATPQARAACLHALHALILRHCDDLARILTLEQGKPLAEAVAEITTGAEYLVWYAEEARRRYGQVIPSLGPGKQALTFSRSVGVAALITPWNFPSSMLLRKMSAALAAGCAIVAKPASATPFSALALGALAEEAGFPAGVVNMVTGKASVVGRELTDHPAVRALSFTGSTAVGKQLMAACAPGVKKVSLELGGNAPYIVFADADLEYAARELIGCKFRNAGQACISANRVLVQAEIRDRFADILVRAMEGLVPGNGLAPGVTLGPLISKEAAQAMQTLVDEALAGGARLRLGGSGLSGLGSNFFAPTLLVDVRPDMRLCREEIFGPLVPLLSFADEAEALALANATPYGLASYLCTRDVGRIWRMSRALEYGMVGVNEVTLASSEVPFGGIKDSGLGREGGLYGLDEYMETRYVLLGDLAR